MNYGVVKKDFEKVGFVNVKIVALEDMVTGWLANEGEIDEITRI